MMFGRATTTPSIRPNRCVGNKRFTNDELRQKFIDITAPQAEFLDSPFRTRSCGGKKG